MDLSHPFLEGLLSQLSAVFGFLLAAVGIAHMLRQKRSPQSALLWFFLMLLVPYLGVPAYLLLGGRKVRTRRREKLAQQLSQGEACPIEITGPIDRLMRTFGLPGATMGNRLHLLPSGEEAYAALLERIEAARRSIHVLMYILAPDAVGREIVRRLARRAREGVAVRLLLDDFGSWRTGARFLAPLEEAGGRVARFMPIFARSLRSRPNLRNHRKIVVFDGTVALSGGANIAHEYMGPTPDPRRWCDLAFLVEGPAVRHFEQVFLNDWEFATGETLPPPEPVKPPIGATGILQVIPSGPDVPNDPLYAGFLTAIFSAQERVWVVTPYFVPDDALEQALCLAARRGVDVRILVPRRSNHPITDLARGTYLRDVQAAGGKVYLYQDGMMHAKALLVDHDLAVIGSANMDQRSLFLDYEIGTLLYSSGEIAAVERWMGELFRKARRETLQAGTGRELVESLARLLAPQL
ncbi:MAG: cardiolipin synthase [Candidatus Poribacteria bacterium]|nr:MAG: cardiolipin synthase [Candidatus Poribacteria bacterium]